ncbi:MAG: Calx-beta domain-containing protein [Gammaproteobacteria bacterium]
MKWICNPVKLVALLLTLVASPVQAVEFTEVPAATSGLSYIGESWGASWGDVNGDRYPDIFVSNHRARPSMWRSNGDGTFTDIVLQFDTSYTWHDFPTIDTHGGAWGDLDNDGDQDLNVLTGNGNSDPPGLFINDGVGITIDEAVLRGVPNDLEGRLATWLDFDADGLLDFVINNRADNNVIGQDSQNLGFFIDQTSAVGLTTERTNYSVLSDIDNDDQMELLGIADGDFPVKVYDIAYTAGAMFTDITSSVPFTGLVLDSVIADLDNDLLPDIFLVRGNLRPIQALKVVDGAPGQADKIETFIAAGPGSGEKGITFQANGPITVTVSSQLGRPRIFIGSGGYIPADDNTPPKTDKIFQLDPSQVSDQGIKPHDSTSNDDQGFYIGYDTATNEWKFLNSPGQKSTRGYLQVDGVDMSDPVIINLGGGDQPITPKYYKNSTSGFSNVSGVGLSQVLSCVSTVAGDFDNDMDLDLYLVCRNGIENIVNRLYLNNGNGSFVEATAFGAEGIIGAGLVSGAGVGENAVIADYDLDGWLDLYVTNGLLMNPIRVGGPDQLFRNTTGNTSTNHWIQLDLVGTVSNRDAIGAKVFATASGVVQLRENNGNYHRWSQNLKRTHFGLAQNTSVDIEVRWPNGDVDIFTSVAADQLYEVTQGLTGSGTGSIAAVSAGTQPPFPLPLAGNECGINPLNQPQDVPYHFDPAQDQSLFIWKDCATTGDWFVRATAGYGSGIEYDGALLSSEAFALVTPFDVEAGNDIVDNTTDPKQIDFFLRMSSPGIDGFDFTVNTSADVCLSASSLPVNGQVLLGKSHLPVSLPLDLKTLNSCIEIAVADQAFNEADGVIAVNVTLSQALAFPATVDYTLVAGTATEGVDYSVTASSGTVTFAANETNQTIAITLLQDVLAEGPETLSLQLSNATGAFVLDTQAIITINDDEINPCGEPIFDPATEKAVFVWKDCTTGDWSVRVTAGGDSAGVMHAGQVNSTADFISVTGFSVESNDVLDISDPKAIEYLLQTFDSSIDGFEFNPVAGALTCFRSTGPVGVPVLVGAAKQTVTGAFDLTTMGPCLDISIDDVSVAEGGGNATFNIALSTSSMNTITVDYVTQAGTATEDADYTGIATPQTLTFIPGETSKPVNIAILQDALMEGDEGFNVVLSNPGNVTLNKATGLATIIDDEINACGTPVFDPATEKAVFIWKDCLTGDWTVRVTAGGDAAGVTHTGLVNSTADLVSVTGFSIESNDALDTTDARAIDYLLRNFVSSVDGFTFKPASGALTCFRPTGPAGVPILIGVSKLTMSGAFDLETLGPCLDISIDDITVAEDGGTADFTLSLSATSTNTVTVEYTTQAGTATEDADYTGVATPQTITFNPGDTSKPLNIDITQDSLMEGDETFSVVLSNTTNATLNKGIGLGIIADDEDNPCGQPTYDKATEKIMVVWKDCVTGEWTVRVTGGGDPATTAYTGDVTSGQNLLNVTGYSLEPSDVFDTVAPMVIDYVLNVANAGEDGFQFTPTSDTGTCLDLQSPALPVLVGISRLPLSVPFDLGTLGACSMATADGDLAPLGAPDGIINAADLLIATRISLGTLTPTAQQLVHGDLYPPNAPDGVINVQDLILIQKLVMQ